MPREIDLQTLQVWHCRQLLDPGVRKLPAIIYEDICERVILGNFFEIMIRWIVQRSPKPFILIETWGMKDF